jgi:hypothetical protein
VKPKARIFEGVADGLVVADVVLLGLGLVTSMGWRATLRSPHQSRGVAGVKFFSKYFFRRANQASL